MIQTSDSSRIYVGNNSITVPYPVPFKFQNDEDLVVVVRDALGVELRQILGTDYTVTGKGDPNGGSIKTTWAVPATSTISISRVVPMTQLTSYEEGDSFPAKSHEAALDKLTMEVQQLARGSGTGTGDANDLGSAFRLTPVSGGIQPVSKITDTVLGVGALGEPILRTPSEMLGWLGQVGTAWTNDAEREVTRATYPGQLGVQMNNWAIYEARSTDPGDWQAFLRYDGIVTATNGVAGAIALPAGDIVGTDEAQTLTNKTLINPSIVDPVGMEGDDVGLGNVDNTSDANKPISAATNVALLSKQNLSERAQPLGYATLDGAGKVLLEQLPPAALGENQYKGTWNAATNNPVIPAAGAGNFGWTYIVAVAGTTMVDGINSWAVGDHLISNGVVWQKVAATSTVISVNTKTGVVVINKADVGLSDVDNTSDATKNSAVATLTNKTIDGANNTLSVRLGSDVSGNLPVSRLNSGTGATGATWWCGDGSWKQPPGTGDVNGIGTSIDAELVVYEGTDGKGITKYAGPTGYAKIAANVPVTAVAKIPGVDVDSPPVGTVLDWAGNEASLPAGYLICDGSLKSKTTYAALYAVIGDLWGTGDATNFRVPDLRGYILAGKDNMGGTNANRLNTLGSQATTVGGSGGDQVNVLIAEQLPSHNHTVSDFYQGLISGSVLPGGAGYTMSGAYQAGNTGYYGGGLAHNNLQPLRVINKIIRY